jgi:hypothetical protein
MSMPTVLIMQNSMKFDTDGVTPRVNDSTVRVAAFEAQRSWIESSAELLEVRDRARRCHYQLAYRHLVAETRAGDQRVTHVRFQGITATRDCSQATLGERS